MKLSLFTIGKLKSKHIGALVDDYAERLSHYAGFDIKIFKDDIQALSNLSASDYFVVLDERGRQISSEEFAEFIQKCQNRSVKRAVFLLGGDSGVSKTAKERADLVLGLSKMTFAHELAQLVFVEQLYRAFTILKHEPYHRR